MPFDNHTRRSSAGMDVSDLFIKCLFKSGRFTLVHPVETIKKLMSHTSGAVGVDERDVAQRIGKSLRCDAVLIGDVNAVGRASAENSPLGKGEMLFEVSARLVHVGSAQTIWLSHYTMKTAARDPVLNRLDSAVAELAESLLQKYSPGWAPDPDAVTTATPKR
jgi:hypothetical protein